MKKYLLVLCICLSGCALTYKIQRHFSQGEQVYIQRRDLCGKLDEFGEIEQQPFARDSNGIIIYFVKDREGRVKPYSEKFLDSLNNWY